jgi:hypothetical protein
VMLGAVTTEKLTPLLFTPLAFTTTLPVVAPVGTVVTIEVALQLGAAVVPLNTTVLVPCVAPKFVPVIVTDAPTAPAVGDKFVMLGAVTTEKLTPLLFTPLAFTTTLPVVAPVGTVATIDVALQLVTVAVVPLNFAVLVPWVVPKPVPVIVTDAPTAPEVGDKLVMLGAATTVKLTPLLAFPPTATTTLPVVAPVGTVTTIDVAAQVPTVAAVPLNLTVLVPWVVPKFDPVIVTDAPTAPVVGERLLTLGNTVNATPLLFTPLAFTTTLPVVAPVGTVTLIDVALQLVIVAGVPLNLTVLVPWVEPKPVPVIVTAAPTAPEVGDKLVMLGAATTVNDTPLLATLLTVTTTLPVVAPVGTVATIDVALQLPIVVAVVPLNLTLLVPCVAPKFVPVIVTDAPTAPEVGDRLVILGVGSTVNATALLLTPLAFTTTLPVVAPVGTVATIDVALQLVTVAVVPLNFAVLVPWVVPKPVPVIVTDAPTAPEVGDKLVMLGAATTVKLTPLLAFPPTATTTLPVVAPVGTVTTIDVAAQVPTVAAVPLNLTVLVPWVVPKFDPVIVTDAPTAPVVGERLLTLGNTVNATPLLFTPLAFTTTLPVVAPVGTVTLIDVALQLVIVAGVPLNLTVLVPWVEPKPVPVIVTAAPTAPEVGDKLVMLGAATTVNDTPLLATLLTVTTTLPVVAPVGTVATIDVALQLPIVVAVVPLNLTLLVPCVAPKFVPVIVTDAPTAPVVGDRLLMLGAAANRVADDNTQKDANRRIRRAIRVTIHLVLYTLKMLTA